VSVLTAQNLAQSHGAFDVFSGIGFDVPEDARIGLVGPNGIGKTTLLRVLAGVDTPTTGSVHRARGVRLGYLRQEAVEAFADCGHTIYAEMLTVFASVLAQAEAMRALETRMAEARGGDATAALLAEYGATQEAFERAGGYTYDVRIAQVLEGLGFPRPTWDTAVSHLSGGQKTRVLLARLLLEAPDLLILDEPTNHLDMEAVAWLEATLRSWAGALLVVSHDRYFLDRVVDRVWEMSGAGMQIYRGNYSAYVRQRTERWERQQQVFDAEKERLEKEIDYIKRNIAGQRTDQAKGKLKRLSRELAAIAELGVGATAGKSWSELGVDAGHTMGVDEAEARIRGLARPPRPPLLALTLKSSGRSGTLVLRAKGLRVGYPTKTLFEADDLELRRGDCAALIGPNGAGKTTFLRTVLGRLDNSPWDGLDPLGGTVTLGAGLKLGYFAQAHDGLSPENRVVDELQSRRAMTEGEARDYLAGYLFRGDDVWKTVASLSGGERGRLALALLALDGANLLLLDEPTNHLDIPAQEVLQEALEHFEGTLLLVSHDRYLVDRLATEVWDVRDGRLRAFDGTYQEFLAAREEEERRLKEVKDAETAAARQAASAATGARRGTQAASDREERKRAAAVAALEREIETQEARLAEWSSTLQAESEAQNVAEVTRLAQEYISAQAHLDTLLTEWATLSSD